MNNINTVLLEGRLKENPNRIDAHECGLTIACRRVNFPENGQPEEEISELPAVVFGTIADTCMDILTKGRLVKIVGRLKQFKWSVDGVQTEKTMIVVEHIEYMPKAV